MVYRSRAARPKNAPNPPLARREGAYAHIHAHIHSLRPLSSTPHLLFGTSRHSPAVCGRAKKVWLCQIQPGRLAGFGRIVGYQISLRYIWGAWRVERTENKKRRAKKQIARPTPTPQTQTAGMTAGRRPPTHTRKCERYLFFLRLVASASEVVTNGAMGRAATRSAHCSTASRCASQEEPPEGSLARCEHSQCARMGVAQRS